MNKKEHMGVAFIGSAVLNSVVYHVHPTSSASVVDAALYSAGPFYALPQISHWLPGLTFEIFLCKLLYFAIAVLAASLPDRIEAREKKGGIVGGHRDFSHSLIFLLSLFVVLIGIDVGIGRWLGTIVEQVVSSILWGLCSAILWHIAADMCTKQGVKVFWPDTTSWGFGPKGLRPRSGSFGTSCLVILFAVVISILFAQGTVGL